MGAEGAADQAQGAAAPATAEPEAQAFAPPPGSLEGDATPAGGEVVVVAEETVVIVETEPTMREEASAPVAAAAPNASDLPSASTGEETATAESSGEPAGAERQEPPQEA
jgi:hypothetical protein